MTKGDDLVVDWFRLLVQLKDVGYTSYAVSHFTGIPKSTLMSYKQGTQPSHQHGERLLKFWGEAIGAPVATAPRISRFSHKA
ncbi:MAG TPA: hypothetical protein VNS29_15270 [Burkholderiaceae bacterium]|nr:hypothetical protein [Burkholderiaceae bacterium]